MTKNYSNIIQGINEAEAVKPLDEKIEMTDMPKLSTFRCAACGETFTKARPDTEAHEEFGILFPGEIFVDADVICHNCWLKLPITQQAKESSEGEA